MNQFGSDVPNTPEMVAYLLFDRIVQADDRLSGPRVSRNVLLDLYAECLDAVQGNWARRGRAADQIVDRHAA